MKNLSKIPVSELKAELERRGYAVQNLWQACDVTSHIEQYLENYDIGISKVKKLTVKQRLNIMNEVLQGDRIMNEVNEAISDEIYNIANPS